jgi:hypothetical protein
VTPRLEATHFEPEPHYTPQAKFVDKTEPAQGISHLCPDGEASTWRALWLRPEPAASVLASAPFLGSRARRESLWADVSRNAIERGDELAAWFNEQQRLQALAILSNAEREAADAREIERQLAEITEEETSPRYVADHLPEALAAFLRAMPPARRREREEAIIDKIGWDGLTLIDLEPHALITAANRRANQYADLHPKDDERFQTPEHRRLRDPKTWRRKLTKQARKARAYVEGAVGAVGGPVRPGRPLYVSDYSVRCYRADLRQSREHMERLRIVNMDDPTVQIPLIDAHHRKLEKEAAKRRLMLDVHLARAEAIGARTVWTTLTLPGRFHPHTSNEGSRAEEWNPEIGPDEAMQEMQKLFHQTMCLLREKGSRPWGFWDAQAQQDGTPHRHLPAFVHDRVMTDAEAATLADPETPDEEAERIRARSDARVLAEARTVADAFWLRFSSAPAAHRQDEARRADHGCRAYVIGDTHPHYAPPKGRDGTEETCASIVKYTARYATRLATGTADIHEAAGGKVSAPDTAADSPASDLERHAAWATSRRARLHNWIGVASNRAPSRLWDAIWKAAERGEMPDDCRMELAVSHMIDAQDHMAEIVKVRAELRHLREEIAAAREHRTKKDEARESEQKAAIAGLEEHARDLSTAAARSAYHACLAMGIWPDRDLHATERLWLREQLDLDANQSLPLPPVPIREDRDNAFDETVRETVGVAAPVVVITGKTEDARPKRKELEAGQMVIDTEDGGWALVTASGEPLQRIILRNGTWKIIDRDKAQEMAEDALGSTARAEQQGKGKDEHHRAMQAAYRESREAETACENADAVSSVPVRPNIGMEDDAGTQESRPTVGIVPASLSLIPTDPRIGATPLPRAEKPERDPPP